MLSTSDPRLRATGATLLAAERACVADDGDERATIHAIPTDADIDPAPLMRPFGNATGCRIPRLAALLAPDVTLVAQQLGAAVQRALFDPLPAA